MLPPVAIARHVHVNFLPELPVDEYACPFDLSFLIHTLQSVQRYYTMLRALDTTKVSCLKPQYGCMGRWAVRTSSRPTHSMHYSYNVF